MRSTLYREDVILTLLREAAAGTPVDEVCSTARISMRTFYRWRARYGGLTPRAARERDELLRENARLRALIHELSADRRPQACGTAMPVRRESGMVSAAVRGGQSCGRFAGVRGRR